MTLRKLSAPVVSEGGGAPYEGAFGLMLPPAHSHL